MLESLHWWCSLDMKNSRPETAEKTAIETTGSQKMVEIMMVNRKKKNKERKVPEMAGVSSPSPITIHVPRRTKISKAVCKDLCFSRNNLTL